MALIRVIDEWLRSPVSIPTCRRAVMVVAQRWAEQRVLMRAYTSCPDQTRPVIVLGNQNLAIGPAGITAHGPWGIHVEPPVDGRAQKLRDALEHGAKRLAKSKGNPARLQDEVSAFDERATGYWTPKDCGIARQNTRMCYEPVEEPDRGKSAFRPIALAAEGDHQQRWAPAVAVGAAAHGIAAGRNTVLYPEAETRATSPWPNRSGMPVLLGKRKLARTERGYAYRVGSPDGDGSRVPAEHIMLSDFELEPQERAVLHMLRDGSRVSAREVGAFLQSPDPMCWMSKLTAKLAKLGLGLISSDRGQDGEATYVLVSESKSDGH